MTFSRYFVSLMFHILACDLVCYHWFDNLRMFQAIYIFLVLELVRVIVGIAMVDRFVIVIARDLQ